MRMMKPPNKWASKLQSDLSDGGLRWRTTRKTWPRPTGQIIFFPHVTVFLPLPDHFDPISQWLNVGGLASEPTHSCSLPSTTIALITRIRVLARTHHHYSIMFRRELFRVPAQPPPSSSLTHYRDESLSHNFNRSFTPLFLSSLHWRKWDSSNIFSSVPQSIVSMRREKLLPFPAHFYDIHCMVHSRQKLTDIRNVPIDYYGKRAFFYLLAFQHLL